MPFDSFLEFLSLCLYYPSAVAGCLFFSRALNISVIVTLNSLPDNSKICVIPDSGSDSDFSCLLACLVNFFFFLRTRHDAWGNRN